MNKREAMRIGMLRLNAMFDAIVARDADAAKAAKERSEARKAKYPPGEMSAKVTFVPKGSDPIRRPNLAGTIYDNLSRRHRRIIERIAVKVKEEKVGE